MLPKKNRIKKVNFLQALKGGYFKESSLLKMYVKNNLSIKNSVFAFVIKKSFIKKASERNKIRRWGYNIIENNLKKIANNVSCVFFIKKTTGTLLSFKKIKSEVILLLNQAGCLKDR